MDSLDHFSALDDNGQPLSLEDALARYTRAFQAKEKAVADSGGRKAPKQARGIDELQLFGWLLAVKENANDIEGKPGAKMYTTQYKALLYKAFTKYNPPLRIKSGLGHVEGNTLRLITEIRRPRTPEEMEAWALKCDEKKMKADDKARSEKNVTEMGPLFTVKSGQIYTFTLKGRACKNNSGSAIKEGVAVLIQGVRAVQDLSGKKPYMSNGKPWPAKLMCSNVMICETKEDISEEKLIRAQAESSVLIDLSEANGYGWEEVEVHQDDMDTEIRGDALSQWKARMEKVPEPERPLVQAVFAMDYRRSHLGRITPAMLLSDKAFYPLKVDVGKDSLLKVEQDGAVTMTCALNIDFQIMEGGDAGLGKLAHPSKRAMATFSPRTYKGPKNTQHVLLNYGIVNPKVWANIGPLLMPVCDALLKCSVDLGGTVTLTTNDMTANPIIDGRPLTGYHFAVRYNLEELVPDLPVGLLQIGLQINLQAARFLLKKSNNGVSDDYGVSIPPEVTPDIKMCPLNNQMDKRAINTFLYPGSLNLLKDSHQFFLVIDYPNAKWGAMQTKMAKNKDWSVDSFSAVVTQLCRTCGDKYYCQDPEHISKYPKSYDDFPKIAEDHDLDKFVVFAVSNRAIEEVRSRTLPSKEQDNAEFHRLLKEGTVAVKKTHEAPVDQDTEQQTAKRVKPAPVGEEEAVVVATPAAEENSNASEDYI